MSLENFSARQKTRAALHRDVRSICTETCHLLGLDITKSSTDVITELVYRKILLYGADLEAFARHAKRSTISADDVKLLVRRNPSLKEHLSCLSNNSTVKKRRKTTNKIEVSAEKTLESHKKIVNETTNIDMRMETDHLEVSANNPTNVKTSLENIKHGAGVVPPARADETEFNETIDLTFD